MMDWLKIKPRQNKSTRRAQTSANVEESFKKLPDLDQDQDDSQNLMVTSLSIETSLVYNISMKIRSTVIIRSGGVLSGLSTVFNGDFQVDATLVILPQRSD